MESKEDFTAAIRKAKAAKAEQAPAPAPEPEAPADPIALAEAKVTAAHSAKMEALEAVKVAQAVAKRADQAHEAALLELSRLRPPLTQAERHKRMVACGVAERRRALENQRLIPGAPRSRLDAVMSVRKGSLGSRRPNYGVVK